MLRTFRTALFLGALALCTVSEHAVAPASAASSNAVASIALTPTGATLKPGDSVTFLAQALNKQGGVVPGVHFTFSSAPSSILSTTSSGTATARAVGFANLTVKTGARSLRTQIAVVPATGTVFSAITGKVQINQVLADDNWIYWTEANNVITRLRKTAKTGGPIFDLASEPARDTRGVSEAYVHIRQTADTLYFSRQGVGFLEHWSIFSVPKAGGPVTQVLAEDISTQAMTASGWQLSGNYLVVATRAAQKLGLNQSTVAAAYNTETKTWSSLIKGNYISNSYYITAGDDRYVYFRGETSSFNNRVLRVDPSAAENTFLTLETFDINDATLDQSGVSDGNNLFVWSNRNGTPKILCYPIDGGTPVVVNTGNFGTGLTTDGSFLYWAKNKTTLVRLLNTGGSPTTLAPNLISTSTSGSVAIDAAKAYIAVALTANNAAITPVTR